MNPLTTVYRDYLVLSEDIKFSKDVREPLQLLLELTTISPVYVVAEISNRMEVDISYTVAYHLFKTVGQRENRGLLFGDPPLAWLLRRLVYPHTAWSLTRRSLSDATRNVILGALPTGTEIQIYACGLTT